MKPVKIGKKSYERIESMFDMGDERFLIFKQHILQSFESLDQPSFLLMHNRIIKCFNASENYQIIIELENFKKSMQLAELDYDCFSFCFALLHLEEGEEQSDFSEDVQKKKLQVMRKNGLDRGLVEEVVGNFMKASPRHFSHYLVMLEAMNSLSKEEILSALAT